MMIVLGAANALPSPPASPRSSRPLTITAHGKTLTIKEWAKLAGLVYSTIYERYFSKGWTAERAVGPRASWFVPKGRAQRGNDDV